MNQWGTERLKPESCDTMENGDPHDGNSSVELSPVRFLDTNSPDHGPDQGLVSLIILNTPISDFSLFQRLYKHANYVVCADGGANRLHDLLISQHSEQDWSQVLASAKPDAIHGDLDSLEERVRKRYEHLGVQISNDPDQYSTDFGKAIKKTLIDRPDVRDVLILGSLSGRVDQGIGLLHEMYREQKFKHPEMRFWLFSEASISFLLPATTTRIHTPLKSGLITRNVGILPIYGKASITIKGFEWDVDDWPTEMGGQVSTSNHITADQVSITSDADVLFTVERKIGR